MDARSEGIPADEKAEYQNKIKQIRESLPKEIVISKGKVWKPYLRLCLFGLTIFFQFHLFSPSSRRFEPRGETVALSQFILALQFGEPVLFPAPKLTDLHRSPSMST